MPERDINLTPSQLKDILESAVRAASAPNALEQKRLDEELEREKRRSLLSIELAKVEEEARWRRQNSQSRAFSLFPCLQCRRHEMFIDFENKTT